MAKRPTKKQLQERRWTNVAQQILHHTSMLAYLTRDALPESLVQARDRMILFRKSWIETGEGDILPASGEDADLDGTLCDVDTFDPIIELLDQKIADAERL